MIYRGGGPIENFVQHYEVIALGLSETSEQQSKKVERHYIPSRTMEDRQAEQRTLDLRSESGTEAHKSAYRLPEKLSREPASTSRFHCSNSRWRRPPSLYRFRMNDEVEQTSRQPATDQHIFHLPVSFCG